jgi:hypothetical protein
MLLRPEPQLLVIPEAERSEADRNPNPPCALFGTAVDKDRIVQQAVRLVTFKCGFPSDLGTLTGEHPDPVARFECAFLLLARR